MKIPEKIRNTTHWTRSRYGIPTTCVCGTKKSPWTKTTRKKEFVTCRKCIAMMGKHRPKSDTELLEDFKSWYAKYKRAGWMPEDEVPQEVRNWLSASWLLLKFTTRLVRKQYSDIQL